MKVFKRDAVPSRLGEWDWPDALFGGMVLASVAGLIYLFTRR
jgi:hypothetical protein